MGLTKISESTPGGTVSGVCDKSSQAWWRPLSKISHHEMKSAPMSPSPLKARRSSIFWGGKKERDGADWEEDTVSIVFSCTKGATALCANMLVDQGKLDLNAKVADYWPEYACNGKEDTTVAMMLDHSAGVPHVRPQVKEGGYNDYDYMVNLVQNEEAFWVPGTRNGYHGVTFAWTVGELVHRASGKRLGQYFADEVAGPWVSISGSARPRT